MDRTSNNWRIRNQLVIALKMTDSAEEALNTVSASWGTAQQARVHAVWRRHVKPQYLICRRAQKRAIRRGAAPAHPFAAVA